MVGAEGRGQSLTDKITEITQKHLEENSRKREMKHSLQRSLCVTQHSAQNVSSILKGSFGKQEHQDCS